MLPAGSAPPFFLAALRPAVLGLPLSLLACLSPLSAARAAQAPQPLVLSQSSGKVEVLGSNQAWLPQSTAASSQTAVTTQLRTGTGRALLRAGEKGQIVMGSASTLRRYQDEADLLSGRYLLRGPLGVHVLGNHLVMDGPGQVRVDLSSSTRRIAVISGTARIILNGKVQDIRAAEQLSLLSGQITPFRETDPWYDAVFRGEGDAIIEATRGPVTRKGTQASGAPRNALIGDTLTPGDALNTGTNAWAEIGFSGGGYLRLCAESELSVLSVERTDRGREVLLRLSKGTAWNVVEKGQGGYKLDTPVVSTAVRGTVFRVDASGLVKVLEGQVALPSNGDQSVRAGQQRSDTGQLGPLQLDELDRLNISLDAERARPLTLNLLRGPLAMGDLTLAARSLPNTRVTVSIAGRTLPLNALTDPPTQAGQGTAYRLQNVAPPLPEGVYRAQISAQRYGQTLTRTRDVVIDRTPPTTSGLQVVRVGRLLTVRGTIRDNLSPRIRLTVRYDRIGSASGTQATYTTHVNAGQAFQWLLPTPTGAQALQLILQDAAGNESPAQDLQVPRDAHDVQLP